jgi:hypothetical protein
MNYPSIRIEGSILSADILDRLDDAVGQRPADFGFDPSVKVKDEIVRAWADAQDYWRIYQRKLETLKEDAPATTETRNLWMVPFLGLLGYQLEYQPKSVELNGKSYALSHRAINRGELAVQIIGSRESAGLDRKPERAALRMSAHAMVQEYLNLTDQLYGLVTNGHLLRLLRDSSRLIKLTYLEFDLDRIFGDGLFADFAILYRLLHVSRLPQSADVSTSCLLEKYHQETIEQGSRIREGLRTSVTEALQELGTGFLAHPDNTELRQQVANGQMQPDVYFNHLLRLIYRLLFLMVIEERRMVFPKGTASKKITLYVQHYSVQRLRRLAAARGLKDARYYDAWLQLLATFHLFENSVGAAVLGTTVLGGQLFSPTGLGMLTNCRLSNAALFESLERLCFFTHPQNGQRLPVNFGALATEEFGSVYESLLELHPVIEVEPTPYFGFRQAAGNERKTSGSYYTPSSLVDCLLDSALDSLLDQAEKKTDPEKAMLSLKVCDPACGSGHFLIAAAQRIARRLARFRACDEEPSLELLHRTLREVIGHCIYGVDINPMSVELCKLGLWLEAVEPGKPLNFLDHHIKSGNSLLGATLEGIREGIPDKAYEPITGDIKEAAKWMKKLNQNDRVGQARFDFGFCSHTEVLVNLPAAVAKLELLDDDTSESLAAKEEHYRKIVESSDYDDACLLHDALCASFFWPKVSTDYGSELTTEHLRKMEHDPKNVSLRLKEQIRILARQYRFFHWHLEFPAVFEANGDGGFDCILGNPPWERVKIQEQEWFAAHGYDDIANAPNTAGRKRLIEALKVKAPSVYKLFLDDLRKAEGESNFIRYSGLYPLCGRGDINLYAIFAEGMRRLLCSTGRLGCVVPTGIATDDTTKFFFQDLQQRRSLVSLYDFINKEGLFPEVKRHQQFSLVTIVGQQGTTIIPEFAFFLTKVEDLCSSDRRITLSADDIALLNPNTRTCPIFRNCRDAELTKNIYNRVPVLIREAECDRPEENPWGITFRRMFDMSNDSGVFRTSEQLEADGWQLDGTIYGKEGLKYLPLYDAKMAQQYNHRAANLSASGHQFRKISKERTTQEQLQNPFFSPMFLYWVPQLDVMQALGNSKKMHWFLGFKDVTGTTSTSIGIFTIIPFYGVGHKFPLICTSEDAVGNAILMANFNSYMIEYILRLKFNGLSLAYFFLKQLPILPPNEYFSPCLWSNIGLNLREWFLPRVLEMIYTAWDLELFAKDCGFDCPPFRLENARRFQLRCELDAAFFHLYGIKRDDVDYIMDTFHVVKRNDLGQYGTYRTKETILVLYDAMNNSQRTGQSFVSPLDPPPADLTCCHPQKEGVES